MGTRDSLGIPISHQQANGMSIEITGAPSTENDKLNRRWDYAFKKYTHPYQKVDAVTHSWLVKSSLKLAHGE